MVLSHCNGQPYVWDVHATQFRTVCLMAIQDSRLLMELLWLPGSSAKLRTKVRIEIEQIPQCAESSQLCATLSKHVVWHHAFTRSYDTVKEENVSKGCLSILVKRRTKLKVMTRLISVLAVFIFHILSVGVIELLLEKTQRFLVLIFTVKACAFDSELARPCEQLFFNATARKRESRNIPPGCVQWSFRLQNLLL